MTLREVLRRGPAYSDAYSALIDLEMWSGSPASGLALADAGETSGAGATLADHGWQVVAGSTLAQFNCSSSASAEGSGGTTRSRAQGVGPFAGVFFLAD